MKNLCFGCMQQKENSPICEHCGFDERTNNHPHQLPVGTLLQNQYLVGRVLGQGGFGITYIGWDQHLSSPVAIKEYFPSGVVQRHTTLGTKIWLANGEETKLFQKHSSRFLKEARVLAQLSDISEIVHIRNYFSQNDTAYIVMEYVHGTTLKDHLKKLGRPMTESEALSTMEPVLKALQKVHDQGLIHRDISPDNIMLPSGGGIKLIDFGTVRYADDSGKSKSTETVLKPGFAPMEQYNARGNLGTWTDVYAICATFHYLLTGKVPADVHARLEEGETLTALHRKDGISEQLTNTLEKGMKLRSAERIQTIQELYDQLYSKHTEPVPSSAAAPALSPKKKKFPLIAAFVLIAAVAAGIFLLSNTPPAVLAEPTEGLSVQQTEAETTAATDEEEFVDLTVVWNGYNFRPEQTFGSIAGTGQEILKVYVGDKRISEFTVRSDNPEYLKASRTRDGLIRLLPLKSFDGNVIGFTVTYEENDYRFYCRDHSLAEPSEPTQETMPFDYPTSFQERHYTDAELQAMVDANLSFQEACEKLSTIGDALQYLTLRGYHYESLSYGMDPATIFEINGGDGVSNASLFNALLRGDYEEQGYVYVFYGMHDNVFNYFVIDGVYYFCDFVPAFFERRESPLYCMSADPSALYNAMLSREPHESNNPSSDLYLLALFAVRTDLIPTQPTIWPRNLPGCNYGQIPFSPAEKETVNILYLRDGYTLEF